MVKKLLVIYYSQSGQLRDVLQNFVLPLHNYEVDFVRFSMKNEFPFPWTGQQFFHAMPESVLEIPQEINPVTFSQTKYDLIILGYQPWFLSPSIPVTSLLKDEHFKQLLYGTPVVTVIGSRNMWLNSQESIKAMLQEAGATLIGNVPFVDRNNNFLSAVSILHWMLTGQKTKKWGIFPKPGISDADIQEAQLFGRMLDEAIRENKLNEYQQRVLKTGKIFIPTDILFIEGRAKKLFLIWAKFITRKPKDKRSGRENMFKYYLLFALFIVAPIVLVGYNLLVRPFSGKAIKRKKAYFYGTELHKK